MGDFLSIDNVSNSNGWTGIVKGPDAEIDETRIDDTIYGTGETLAKMGSSIPTIIARMYFFATAFDQINTEEALNRGLGHQGKQNKAGHIEPTSYHYLASECLDLLEFLFQYGDDKDHTHFVAKEWVVGIETTQLKNSGAKHRKLANAILSSMGKPLMPGERGQETNPLYPTDKIYLFYWQQDGKTVLLGGTSPISLVFTSPNLTRELKKNGWTGKFKGLSGNTLFDDTKATPLYQRSYDFRTYLYCLAKTMMREDNCSDPNKATPFYYEPLRKYIETSLNVYDTNLESSLLATGFETELKKVSNERYLTDSLNRRIDIAVGDLYSYTAEGRREKRPYHVPLLCSPNKLTLSDYRIRPTTNIYETMVVNGDTENVDTPLVLCEEGISGAIYVSGRAWMPGTDIIPKQRSKNLNKRVLPNTTINHPYLDIDDFLEEKIIEVSYPLNKGRFYTGTGKTTSFLLPLKKNFFQYFTLKDLMPDSDPSNKKESLLHMEFEDDIDTDSTIVTVELTIPIAYSRPVVFRKVYKKEDQVDCYDTNQSFNFAIFPFLRQNSGANQYAVMLGYTIDTGLRFYRFQDLTKQVDSETDERQVPGVVSQQRADAKNNTLNTKHYRIPSEFDLIEVDVTKQDKRYSGLVIPLFMEANSNTKDYIFSIDFGTTNTYVAFATQANGSLIGEIEPFKILPDEDQTVTLNEENNFGTMGIFSTNLNREFVPDIIDDSSEGKRYQFPIRTASCELKEKRIPRLELFNSCNVGFNYNNELITKGLSCQYRTNLKWNRNTEDQHDTERLRAFFTEMLWMMRNKSLLNEGGEDFDVVITYPISMGDTEFSDFKTAWINACSDLKLPENYFKDHIKFETESITPYYAFLRDLQFGQPYMNIDIGGGTTDILYVNPVQKEYATFSALFAANDIWGDGCNRAVPKCENGFVEYYRRSKFCKENPLFDADNLRSIIENTIQNGGTSADVISYLFSQSTSKFADAIRRSPEMRQMPLAHFAALMFYVCNIIDTSEYAPPKLITFTGLGSKYINLISDTPAKISKLIRDVFCYYGKAVGNTQLQKAEVEIKFADNPKEVTARGAIMMNTDVGREREAPATIIYGYSDESFGDKVRYSEINSIKPQVFDLYKVFTQLFDDSDFISDVADIDIGISNNFGAELRQYAEQSYELLKTKAETEKRNPNLRVKEPLFFWPIKDALYQLSKQYCQQP